MRKKIMELKEKKKVFCVNCRHLLYLNLKNHALWAWSELKGYTVKTA